MRLVFLYVSWKHGFDEGIPFEAPYQDSENFYAQIFQEEGYCLLLQEMLNYDIIDDVLIVIESKSNPGRFMARNMPGVVMPSIQNIWRFLKEDDIIWVRGGWKHWHDTLVEIQKMGHWILLYAANTGRQKWKFWDVVFNDRIDRAEMDKVERLQFPFKKPINEDVFKPQLTKFDHHDIMIGASHIHDKKGQWRVIDALIEYKKLFGENLKAILPGSFMRGVETNKIITKIKNHDLDVWMPGMMDRKDLAQCMNITSLFVHLGSHGQADRGPIEAMACGCPVMIGYPQYHAKWLVDSPACITTPNPEDPEAVAKALYFNLPKAGEFRKDALQSYKENSVDFGSIPDMAFLFSYFKAKPMRDPEFFKTLKWR